MTEPPTSSITLAVVTRDRAELFERNVLHGLVAVAREGVAVVVVDQSTDDRTEKLVRLVPGACYLRSGPGLSVGRNVALGAVTTAIVAFTDDDVRIDTTWIERVGRAFEESPRAGAVCGRATSPAGDLLPGGAHGEHREPAEAFALGSGFNLSLRMEALREVGGFDEDLGAGGRYPAAEDSEMLYRLLRAGWSVECRDDVTVVHDDWRTKREEFLLHYRYGVGSGAQTAKHVRAGDGAALQVGGRRILEQCVRVVRSTSRGNLRTAAIETGFVVGMIVGFAKRMVTRTPLGHPMLARP